MKTKYMIKVLFTMLLTFAMVSCGYNEDVIEDLVVSREFAPVALTARVRNQTTVELNWTVNTTVDHYVVQFSEDDPSFGNILLTVNVDPSELPFQVPLEGETLYSVRVKAVSNRGLDDSTWATVTAETGFENIFYALDGADITSSSVTLRWPAGREVTHFIINPGNVNRTITAGEITAGEATITELTSETQYMVTMYNGTKRKGEVTFETLIDIGGATPVYPTDDLLAKIAEASDGDVLALFPGEYGSIDAGLTIAFDKSITLKGVFPYDRPVIYGQITCGTTVTSIDVQSIIFVGTGYGQFFNVTSSSCNLGTLIINDCDISGYDNNILYNNNSGALGDITISNCYVHDIAGGGGDGLDFRSGTISSLTVENSTFANGLRTFLRMQAECNTVINSCTLYQVSIVDSGNNRGLFRSSGGGTIEVKNCIVYGIGIAGTTRGFWTRAGDMTATASYSNNYYFDSPVLFAVGSEYTDPAEVDATEADPGFADAANEDFTISNQTLLDNQVGDPRWRQ